VLGPDSQGSYHDELRREAEASEDAARRAAVAENLMAAHALAAHQMQEEEEQDSGSVEFVAAWGPPLRWGGPVAAASVGSRQRRWPRALRGTVDLTDDITDLTL
jgi:hypothetical protein